MAKSLAVDVKHNRALNVFTKCLSAIPRTAYAPRSNTCGADSDLVTKYSLRCLGPNSGRKSF